MDTLTPSEQVESVLVPEGTRLVHIGPHKTGTSALQGAFHLARPALAEQGVHYAGRTRQPLKAVHAVTDKSWHSGGRPSMRAWEALVREVRESTARRVVISSEAFADGDEASVRRVVEAFGPDRVHIAVTLRSLARILPSQWQQAVAGGLVSPYEGWLRHSFANPSGKVNQFWHRHRHDRLIERWASVVGPENVTVVVVDDRDHALALRAFERLVGLREGTLQQEHRLANRSMTLPEAEAVRAFNIAYKAEALPMTLHAEVMRVGAARMIKQGIPPEAWPRVETPQWALDMAVAIEREMVDTIAASGVRVIGDLERLTEAPVSGLDGGPAEVLIPPEVAGSLAMSVLHAMGVPRNGRAAEVEDPRLAGVSSRRLARALLLRTRRAALTRASRLTGRGGGASKRKRPPEH